jgi:hypothetical protein
MVETSWPFVEWTQIVGKKGDERLIVDEEVLLGDDVVGNMGALTKVEIFSSMFRPSTLSIKGEKVRGIIAENREGEYFYYALFEDVHAGEKLRLKILIEGKSTRENLKENGYYSNFAWNTKHVQRIVFPKGWKIISAIPKGYVLETFESLPAIKWERREKFWGDIQVKIEKTENNRNRDLP